MNELNLATSVPLLNHQLKRGWLSFLLIALAFPEPSLAANIFGTGDDWMKWTEETRIVSVSAYLWGQERGFRDGCQAGQRIYSAGKLQGLPGENCIPKHPQYSKNVEEYAQMITDFYRSYPDDAGVPIFKLLDAMSDSKHLTVQKMHEYYGRTKTP